MVQDWILHFIWPGMPTLGKLGELMLVIWKFVTLDCLQTLVDKSPDKVLKLN